MRLTRAEAQANAVLRDAGPIEIPVNVEAIATRLGAVLSFQPFDDASVSGLLYRDPEKTVIGVNESHHRHRQRFTIAHEIGHLVLHEKRSLIVEKLARVHWRDDESGRATKVEEIQANGFAAELLMPRQFVETQVHEVLSHAQSTSEDDLVATLATRFDVSTQAMEIRLVNLGVIQPAAS